MGHFDKDDLVDLIRHEMRLEDEDGPGLCSRLLLNPNRRAKHGGLPLNFRRNGKQDDNEDSEDDIYEIPPYEEKIHTRTIINKHLTVKTEQKIKEERGIGSKIYGGDLNELFRPWGPEVLVHQTNEKSAIDKYLEENSEYLDNPLREYLQFAATSDAPSKTITIIYPPPSTSRQDFETIKVSVASSTRVRDVIGYCMLIFYQTFGEMLPGEVGDYQLFLAEDYGEIETALPPMCSSKLIGQLGFECLGLVNRKRESNGQKMVIVHFVDQHFYNIEVDNMEKPLRWLRDEALRLYDENVKHPKNGLLRIREYDLEAIDQFDVKLDLESTIASTRCHEFVMIRKNSARAGFHPKGARYGRQVSTMLALKMPNSPIAMAPITPLPIAIEQHEETNNAFEFSSPTVTWDDAGGQLSCHCVMRIHKFKPKWKAKLFIRWTCFEIDKFAINKHSFLPQGYQKSTKVPWEFVGGLNVQQKESKPGKVDTWQITIYWLSPLPDSVIHEKIGKEEWSLSHVAQLYQNEEKWKFVTVESAKKSDVDNICSQINSILNARDASIHRAFKHSSLGSRSPAASVDLALMDTTECPILSPTDPTVLDKPNGKFKRMSKILLNPVNGVIWKNN